MEHHIGIGVSRLHSVGVVRRIATDAAHTVTTLVGGWWGVRAAYVDGAGTVARLGASTSVATLAGNGDPLLTDGDGAHAGFALPTALAVGADGQLWVVDRGNTAIRAVTLP